MPSHDAMGPKWYKYLKQSTAVVLESQGIPAGQDTGHPEFLFHILYSVKDYTMTGK